MTSQKAKIFNFLVSVFAVLLATPFMLDQPAAGFLQKTTWFMYLFLWISLGISIKEILNVQFSKFQETIKLKLSRINIKTIFLNVLYATAFALPWAGVLNVLMRNHENQMNILPFTLLLLLAVLSCIPFLWLTSYFKKHNIKL